MECLYEHVMVVNVCQLHFLTVNIQCILSYNRIARFFVVANVAFETTEVDLKAVLEQAGPVLHFR